MGFLDGLFGKKKKSDDARERRRNASVRLKNRMTKLSGPNGTGEQDSVSDEDTAEDSFDSELGGDATEVEISLDGLPDEAPAAPTKPLQPAKSDRTTILKPNAPDVAGDADVKKPSGRFLASNGPRVSVTVSGRQRRRTSIAKKQMGSLLLAAQAISEKHLEKALQIQESEGGLLGQILVGMGVCQKSQVGAALNKQRTITSIALEEVKFDPEALAITSREFCEKHRLIPFEKIGTILCIAMANVLDSTSGNELRELTQLKVKKFDAPWSEIEAALQKQFSATGAAAAPAASAPLSAEVIADGESVIDLDDEDLDDLIIELPDEKSLALDGGVDVGDELEELEELEELDDGATSSSGGTPAPTARPAGAIGGATPSAVLQAIPISDGYLAAVVQDQAVDTDARWLAESAAAVRLPVLPSIRTV